MSACDQWKGPSTKKGVSCERGAFKYNKKPWSALWTSKDSLIVVYFLKPNSPPHPTRVALEEPQREESGSIHMISILFLFFHFWKKADMATNI